MPVGLRPRWHQEKKFGLQRVVLVGDRGLLTETQINHLKRHPGLGWISALRHHQIRRLVESEAVQLSLFDERHLAESAARTTRLTATTRWAAPWLSQMPGPVARTHRRDRPRQEPRWPNTSGPRSSFHYETPSPATGWEDQRNVPNPTRVSSLVRVERRAHLPVPAGRGPHLG